MQIVADDGRRVLMGTLASLVPLALGVALSPLPVVAVLVILLTARARSSSLIFAAAWVLGNATAVTIAILFAGTVRVPRQGLDLPFEGLITALLGIGLVVTALLARRGRMRSEDPFAAPGWVRSIDNLSPLGGAVVAVSNAMTSPKNLALAIAAGVIISNGTKVPSERTALAIFYVTVASVTVLTPVITYFVAGKRATPILSRWKQQVTRRAAAIVELSVFVLGAVLALKGLYNLVGR